MAKFQKNFIENTKLSLPDPDRLFLNSVDLRFIIQGGVMTITDIIGFFGVFLLLIAFFLNLTAVIRLNSSWYLFLNLAGSGLACLASAFLKFVPFIILEGIWALVSLVALIRLLK